MPGANDLLNVVAQFDHMPMLMILEMRNRINRMIETVLQNLNRPARPLDLSAGGTFAVPYPVGEILFGLPEDCQGSLCTEFSRVSSVSAILPLNQAFSLKNEWFEFHGCDLCKFGTGIKFAPADDLDFSWRTRSANFSGGEVWGS